MSTPPHCAVERHTLVICHAPMILHRRVPQPLELRALRVIPLLAALVVGGCSTPPTGPDTLAAGRRRVVELINDAGSVLPSHEQLGDTVRSDQRIHLGFASVDATGLDRERCYKKFLGFSMGSDGAEQPEVRTIVDFPLGTNPQKFLPIIERHWRSLGYRIDVSRLHNSRYPQVKAFAGAYTIFATSLGDAAGFASSPRLTMYAVATCLTATGNRRQS